MSNIEPVYKVKSYWPIHTALQSQQNQVPPAEKVPVYKVKSYRLPHNIFFRRLAGLEAGARHDPK
jgi:hypothetical protein